MILVTDALARSARHRLSATLALALLCAGPAQAVTFNLSGSGYSTAANDSNGAASPNLIGITAGYFNGASHLTAGATAQFYSGNGLGVSSPTGCPSLPADTSTTRYRCNTGSDAHYVDNSGNGARIERSVATPCTSGSGCVNGLRWGSYRTYEAVPAYDDFVRFQFSTDVVVTSITLGIWDAVDLAGSSLERIDVSYNAADAIGSGWTAGSLDFNWTSNGQTITFSPTAYVANDWFGFGAGFGLSGTGFKIKSLTVEVPERQSCEAPCGSVPLPGTAALLGLGAAAIGWSSRRRRRA